jgi:hypothetical protein
MASRVAGEAKFSEAISLRLARWSASSAAIEVAISGATSPTTSMAAAKASASALTPLRSASGQTVRRYEARVESAFMGPLPVGGGRSRILVPRARPSG